jgi:integrase
MSVDIVKREGGRSYKVRYRDAAGKPRAESYSRKADADKRDAEIRQSKERREPIPPRGRGSNKETFEDFARVWWAQEVLGRKLSPKTQERYATFLDKHLIPRIGDEALAYIDVPKVLAVRESLISDEVKDYTAARTLKLLRQVLHFAVVSGRITQNPADVLSRPKMLPPQRRKGDVLPLYADEVEVIRAAILKGQSPHKLRNAAMVTVGAYAGLRPIEITELPWGSVGEDSLRVHAGKTGKSRTVPDLIQPLLDDLAAWRAAAPSTAAKALVFPADSGDWTATARGNWRNRVFSAHAPEDATPYSLRHGYALMLAREGIEDRDAAARMGHSLTMHNQHYDGFIQALRGKPRETMEAAAKRARSGSSTP